MPNADRHIWQNKRKDIIQCATSCYFFLFFKEREGQHPDMICRYIILWQSDCAKQNIFNAKELTSQ